MSIEQHKDTQKVIGSEGKLTRSEERMPPTFISPVTLMGRLVDDLARMMDGFSPTLTPRKVLGSTRSTDFLVDWVPAIEIFERDGKLTVRAEVPGLGPEDLNVEIQNNNTLVISGQRTREREEGRGDLYRSERRYGSFYRALVLPEGVRLDEARASFNNGVLEIVLALEQRPEAQRRQIPVQPEAGSAKQADKNGNGQSPSESQASPSA